MGRETWFEVIGQGYEVAKDGFGYRGVRLTPKPGMKLKVEAERTNLAKRLGRLTGAGLFAESQKLGLEPNWPESGVLGCDSVQNAEHNGRLFWVWGDTTLARYPLGIFNGTGATTAVRPLNSFEPPLRLNFDYFRDDHGLPRGMAKVPGEGPTWMTGFASVRDRIGQPHLVASYMKIKPPMEAYQLGLAIWNGTAFETLRIVWTKSGESPKPPPIPEGHPIIWTNAAGEPWLLFGNPFPNLKCPATYEAWQDPSQWQPLTPQKRVAAAGGASAVEPHSGSIAWNPWRKRWVSIFMQRFGQPTAFGELWYAEADSPTGPWGPAVKVLSHDHYTFYNPRLHPEFTPGASPVLLFEGTYTIQFSDNHQPTPRYDYNQVLYRLDLDTPALAPARSP